MTRVKELEQERDENATWANDANQRSLIYERRAEAAEARAQRLEQALRAFMTLADEWWEDWLFESEEHEYEQEEWTLARAALEEATDGG